MERQQWLAEHPFTLVLGAGFFGFFSHTGLLAALEAANLRPQRVVGVSAGALAGGLWASGLDARTLAAELNALRRHHFWDPGVPLGGFLRGRKFAEKLQSLLAATGVEQIEQCETPFCAVVHDVLEHCTVVLDRGPLDLAIRASCTVPGMFRPVWSQGRLLVDGGVSDRSGFAGIRTGERVLLHELKSNRKLRLRPYAPPTAVPGADAIMLVTPDLPRVHPFQLERGPLALEHTRAYVEAWLSEPVGQSFQSVGARGSGRYAQ